MSLLLLVIGVILRIVHYLENRSLWLDEAALARNILDRNTLDLFAPLDHSQGAPPLFLLLVDATTLLFGPSELSLRLIPLLASIAGCILILLLARSLVHERYIPVLMFMFAFSYHVVYYAQELKQYSVDAAVALGLTYAFARFLTAGKARPVSVLLLAVLGALGIWLSHPSVFILAGIATSLIILILQRRGEVSFGGAFFVIGLWAVSFSVNYFLCLKWLGSDDALLSYWQSGFLPIPMTSAAARTWLERVALFLSFSRFPTHWSIFVLVLMAAAAVGLVRDRSPQGWTVILSFAFALTASVLHQYPFSGRLSYYLVPFTYILAVRGLQELVRGRHVVIALAATLLLLPPFVRDASFLMTARIAREEVRPLLHYLNNNCRTDDRVYVYYGAEHAVKYYASITGLDQRRWHYGICSRDERSKYLKDIEMMKQWPRVWFLFAHVWEDERALFLSNIDGRLLKEHHRAGADLYLYSFDHRSANRAVQPPRESPPE